MYAKKTQSKFVHLCKNIIKNSPDPPPICLQKCEKVCLETRSKKIKTINNGNQSYQTFAQICQ